MVDAFTLPQQPQRIFRCHLALISQRPNKVRFKNTRGSQLQQDCTFEKTDILNAENELKTFPISTMHVIRFVKVH